MNERVAGPADSVSTFGPTTVVRVQPEIVTSAVRVAEHHLRRQTAAGQRDAHDRQRHGIAERVGETCRQRRDLVADTAGDRDVRQRNQFRRCARACVDAKPHRLDAGYADRQLVHSELRTERPLANGRRGVAARHGRCVLERSSAGRHANVDGDPCHRATAAVVNRERRSDRQLLPSSTELPTAAHDLDPRRLRGTFVATAGKTGERDYDACETGDAHYSNSGRGTDFDTSGWDGRSYAAIRE